MDDFAARYDEWSECRVDGDSLVWHAGVGVGPHASSELIPDDASNVLHGCD